MATEGWGWAAHSTTYEGLFIGVRLWIEREMEQSRVQIQDIVCESLISLSPSLLSPSPEFLPVNTKDFTQSTRGYVTCSCFTYVLLLAMAFLESPNEAAFLRGQSLAFSSHVSNWVGNCCACAYPALKGGRVDRKVGVHSCKLLCGFGFLAFSCPQEDAMELENGQIVLEEAYDGTYEPTEEGA